MIRDLIRRSVPVLLVLGLLGVFLVLQSGVLAIRTEELRIPSGDVTLAATLHLPRDRTPPFPTAVVVHGSGSEPRATLGGFAHRLVPHGIAVLTYDKRGTGRSGGRYAAIRVSDSAARLSQLAADVLAAARAVRAHPAVDARRVGLIGGSQAGWIMPLAAVRGQGAVAFLVSISGPACTYGEEIEYNRLTGEDPGTARDTRLTDAEIAARIAAFPGPHGYDPVPVLDSLAVPSLWLYGGRDRSVPVALCLENLEPLRLAKPALFSVTLYPEGDHSLRDADGGERIDYWSEIRAWLGERGFLAVRGGSG